MTNILQWIIFHIEDSGSLIQNALSALYRTKLRTRHMTVVYMYRGSEYIFVGVNLYESNNHRFEKIRATHEY